MDTEIDVSPDAEDGSTSERAAFDSDVYAFLAKALEAKLASGATEEEASVAVSHAFSEVLEDVASTVARYLVDTAPAMLRDRRRLQKAFEKRLRIHWGEALDRYFTVVVCAEEAGANFNRTNRPRAVRDRDHVFVALVGLHARACRVALEVHRLLSGGLPQGALSRCRTLHELAVTALVLADYGRRPEHSDLANRFLLHSAVISYEDAKVYQERCQVLGTEPFSDAEMEEMQRQHDALSAKYGKKYTQDNGWAAELLAPERPTFKALENLAKLAHLRSYYKWGCHEVHSNSKGLHLNDYERGGVVYLSTGPVNIGLAEPGHLALISLYQCTAALLLNGSQASPPGPWDLVALKALEQLIDEAGCAFGDGQAAVDEAEAQFQKSHMGS